jgi:hypothetical protein
MTLDGSAWGASGEYDQPDIFLRLHAMLTVAY